MPRDGSNIYSQPDPDVVADTTIESAKYNNFTNDVTQDLNLARPIVAGGTGASSATDARFNLATEVATQIVTNYDSHVWVPGSFRSTSSATNPPVASHSFAGWCYINEALANPPTNQNVVVHAYDFDALATTPLLYTRQKKAGVWSNWSITTTEVNQAGARQAIYAAPLDAMAYNGMQINGSMEVSQENGLNVVVVSGGTKYIVDGWQVQTNGAQNINAYKTDNPAIGFPSNINVFTVTTGNPSPAAGNYCILLQSIEGYRMNRLNWGLPSASAITIGFWVAASRTGTASGSIRNAANNRSYAFTYTINVVSAWEYKTITIPGDTTGAWVRDNGIGLNLSLAQMCGTTFATAPNTWVVGNFIAATGTINCCATTSDFMLFTGVVVLPGTEAPSAARSPLIMRPTDQELITCMRYWQNNAVDFGEWITTTTARVPAQFVVPMRIAPAMAIYNGTNTIERLGVGFLNVTAVTSSGAWTTGAHMNLTTGTSAVAATAVLSSHAISFDARL